MKYHRTFAAIGLIAAAMTAWAAPERMWLDELDLSLADQTAGEARANMSMWRTPIVIAGDTIARGVGTHALGVMRVALDGRGQRFHSRVGVDASAPEDELRMASVEFSVDGDGRRLWSSGPMTAADSARTVDVALAGISELVLRVDDCGDGIVGDRADWGDAYITYDGAAPRMVRRSFGERVRLTPPAAPEPEINAPYIFGVRPGNPFMLTLPVSGSRDGLEISVAGLPAGLTLDSASGIIRGTAPAAGDYTLRVTARNDYGRADRDITLRSGDRIELTPPMGWNSWNVYGPAVSDSLIRRAIDVADSLGLQRYGYRYINIDDGWQARRGGRHNAVQPNEKFPDMKALADYAHFRGFKLGIYSSPWVETFAGYVGGSADTPDGRVENSSRRKGQYSFAANDVAQWVDWGMDYLKYDWVTNDVASTSEMASLLAHCGRDIGFSISNAAPFALADRWAALTNCWRTTGDIKDTWNSMTSIGFNQNKWQAYSGPGHYNDPDMLVVGKVGWGDGVRDTGLSPAEQYTHISLWSLLAAPMLMGCDLTQIDDFTLGLLTNPEVLAVNQDPLCLQGRRVRNSSDTEVWARTLADGGIAVGLFNIGDTERTIGVDWAELGLTAPATVRDLWRRTDIGTADGRYEASVGPHDVVFVKLSISK